MLVWSEVSLKAKLVQPLRVTCTTCGGSYIWLAQDQFASKARGLPYVSLFAGGESRRQHVAQSVQEGIAARRPLKNHTGRCPTCQSNPPLQPRGPLRRSDYLGPPVMWGLIGTAAGWVISWFITGIAPVIVGGSLGLLFGLIAVFLLRAADPDEPVPAWEPKPEPWSATEETWNSIQDKAAAHSAALTETLGAFDFPALQWIPEPEQHADSDQINHYAALHEGAHSAESLFSSLVAAGHDPSAVAHILRWREQCAELAVRTWLRDIDKSVKETQGEALVALPLHDWHTTHEAAP